MLLRKLSIFICASFAPCMVFAQDNLSPNNTDTVIDAFLQCDNQFFEQLTKNQALFSQYVDLAITDNIAYIPVEDVQNNEKNRVMFKTPIKYNGLTISGYQNIYIETPLSGQYYYWGFILNNSVDDVRKALNKLDWSQYNSATYIANAKIHNRQDKLNVWQNNPYTIDNVIPKLGTVEKSIYLEPTSENQVNLVCSIQGDIEKNILYSTRPDIKPVDEKIEAKRQKMIDAYKLKKQQEQEKAQLKKDANDNSTKNNKKDGDSI